MNFRIAIPSSGRSELLLNKTIKYLKMTNIDFKNVDIFLSKADELNDYTDKLKEYPVNIIVANNDSINAQRNFMVRYYDVGQCVIGIDDDINSIESKINDKKTFTLIDLVELGEHAFSLCKKYKLNLWGINSSFNPFFMKNNISFNLKFIAGGFYGWINSKDDKSFVLEERYHLKEDYERTIKYYRDDGGVIRYNYLAPNTKVYAYKGGIQDYRTPESEKKGVDYMLETYPMFCKINNSRKSKFAQIRLFDQRKKSSKRGKVICSEE